MNSVYCWWNLPYFISRFSDITVFFQLPFCYLVVWHLYSSKAKVRDNGLLIFMVSVSRTFRNVHLKFLTFSQWCYFLVQRFYLGNHSCKSSSRFPWFLCLHIYSIFQNDVLLRSHFLLEAQLSGYMKLHLGFHLLWVWQHNIQV